MSGLFLVLFVWIVLMTTGPRWMVWLVGLLILYGIVAWTLQKFGII